MTPEFWVGLALGSVCGCTIGLFLGACLGAGKISDLETANHRLRKLLFEEGKEARFSEIEDAAEEMEAEVPDWWDEGRYGSWVETPDHRRGLR